MLQTLLLLSSLLASGYADPVVNSSYKEQLNRDIIFLNGDTSNFSNAAIIGEENIYYTTFSATTDIDYYRFAPASSGIFTFSVLDGKNVNVSVYGSANNENTLLTSYVVNSNETNFGYNHGVFLNLSIYDHFFYVVQSASFVLNTPYTLSVEKLALKNSSFDLFRFDVASKTYKSIGFSSTGSGMAATSGYMPGYNGSVTLNFSAASTGTDITLSPANGYNTTNTYPYSAIAAIGPGHDATAFLIGPNVVATAAHCVGDTYHIYENVNDKPLYFGSNHEYATIQQAQTQLHGVFTSIYISPHYFDNDGLYYKYDMAFGILDDDYGNEVGYLPIAKVDSYSMTSSQIVVCGYAGGTDFQRQTYLDYFTKVDTEIRYTYYASNGASGGPCISYSHGKVMAVHSGHFGTEYCAGKFFTTYRFAIAEQLIGGTVL